MIYSTTIYQDPMPNKQKDVHLFNKKEGDSPFINNTDRFNRIW